MFAVPGDVISSAFTGANKLIHDGAKPVFSPLDILEEYVYTYSDAIHPQAAERVFQDLQQMLLRRGAPVHGAPAPVVQKETPKTASAHPVGTLPETASQNAKAVYAALGDGERHIDELCETAALSVGDTLAALTELELYGCAALTQGKKYKKI